MKMESWLKILIVVAVAVIGTLLTIGKSQDLRSPLQPQSYWFSIVWTILYVLYAWAWCRNKGNDVLDILFLFGILLNFSWIVSFFVFKLVGLSQLIIMLMIVVSVIIVILTITVQKDIISGFFILAYTSWLICAAVLNFTIKDY
jgi:tryptophan-rich sensory protein